MKRILRLLLVGALGGIGLGACDPATPPDSKVAGPVEPEAIPPGETLTDVVRVALVEIVRDDDAYSRARRLGALLPTLGPDTVQAAVQTLGDPTVELRASEIEMLVRYWAAHQPEEAASWAKEKSPLNYRVAAVYSALRVWAEADPQAAVDVAWPWMAETTFERIVPVALVRGWYAADDAPAFAQWLRNNPIGIFRQRAIAAYIRVLNQKQGAEAVMRWAESLPDGDKGSEDATYKLAVFRRVVDSLSLLDNEAALHWCKIHCDGPYGENMRSLIARNWLRRDGPSAMAWLSSAPESSDRDFAVQLAFALWTRTDREAALAWIKTQTSGEPEPWLQPALPVYAKLLAISAPAEGIVWAERIEDDQKRESVLVEIARVWRHVDEAAAEQWLLESSLSEEAREKVRGFTP
jgi:hypothetical protein